MALSVSEYIRRFTVRIRSVPGGAVAILMGTAVITTFSAVLILSVGADSAKSTNVQEIEPVAITAVPDPGGSADPPTAIPRTEMALGSPSKTSPERNHESLTETISKEESELEPGAKLLVSALVDSVAAPEPTLPSNLAHPPDSVAYPGEVSTNKIVPPAWRRFAVAIPETAIAQPMVALVIDDLGHNAAEVNRVTALTGPLTLAFLPYVENLSESTETARTAGHELLLHLPMEPENQDQDPGPNALVTSTSETELLRRLEWNLSRFEGYVGVNNHMGSRFTREHDLMESVLQILHSRGLLFLDSRTTHLSVGASVAKAIDLPTAERDVFIDHIIDPVHVRSKLTELEAVAASRGHAVGIGHPHSVTVDELVQWLPTLKSRGFSLVPISTIAALTSGRALPAAAKLPYLSESTPVLEPPDFSPQALAPVAPAN